MRRLNEGATGGLRPDLYVVLDVEADAGLGRKEGRPPDRIEQGGRAFHERVARAYRELTRSEPDAVLVDATCPPDRVYEEVASVLTARFPETFGGSGGSSEGGEAPARRRIRSQGRSRG